MITERVFVLKWEKVVFQNKWLWHCRLIHVGSVINRSAAD